MVNEGGVNNSSHSIIAMNLSRILRWVSGVPGVEREEMREPSIQGSSHDCNK